MVMGLVSALVVAHRSGAPFPAASVPAPASFEAAEAMQAEVAVRLDAEVAGWKVGMAPDGERAVAAPLFRHLILPEGGAYARGEATFLAIEVEIGFRLQADQGTGDVEDALGAAFVDIEIVRSRFVEGPGAPYLSFLADNIGNGGYAVGPEQPDWRALDLSRLRCRVWKDDALVHDALGGHPQGHPLAPLTAHRPRPIDRLGGIRAGQIVTTGTLCGVMRIDRPCAIRAEVEGFGEIGLDLGGEAS